MADEPESRSLDILGIKPVADTIHDVTKATIEGAEAILSRICLPAAKEFGLLLKDKVHAYRTRNQVVTTNKAGAKMAANGVSDGAHAPPRIVHTVLEEAAWVDDGMVQDMWAGLLASACTDDGEDDSNLIFTNLLGSLTKLQARVLKYACEKARKEVVRNGLAIAAQLSVSLQEFREIAGEHDIHRLDRELDHLRGLELCAGGIDQFSHIVDITPTPLALHMYVRCQGSRQNPVEYFAIEDPYVRQPAPPP